VTRVQATVALLQALNDYFPHPETWTGELQRRSTVSGPAPSRREVCPDCEGRRKTRTGWICSTCKGQGTLWRDAYTLERVERHEPVESPERFRESFRELLQRFVNCSCCGGWGRLSADSNMRPRDSGEDAHPICDGCFGTGRVPAPFTGVFRAELDRPERERTGDAQIDALDRGEQKRGELSLYRDHLLPGLSTLKRLDRYGHLLVQWVWIMGAQNPESLPAEGTRRLVEATLTLAAGMPDGFERRLPAEVHAQVAHREASLVRAKGKGADRFAQRARDEEIRRLHRGGASLDELASRYRIDRSRVSRITRAA
jgi:hypothetical protein